MLQARMSQADPRLYSTDRDLAHNFGDVMRETAARLEDGRWEPVKKYLEAAGVSPDDVGEACAALCLFVGNAAACPGDTMATAMARAGWFGDKVKPEARVAVMAVLGTVVTGYYFAGVRHATLDGRGPTDLMADLRAAGGRSCRLLFLPAWRAWPIRAALWARRVWAALWGRP